MTATQPHGMEPPSPWIRRWSHLVTPQGTVLDVACGHGRHAYWFHEKGHAVTLVDRSQAAVDSIALPRGRCEKLVADIESGRWPFTGRQFDAVILANYLWRPLMPALLACLAPDGVLVYETFTEGNGTVGKPSRAEFLLRTGELLTLCQSLRVVAFEDGFQDASPPDCSPSPRFIQRIVAINAQTGPGTQPDGGPARYPLP